MWRYKKTRPFLSFAVLLCRLLLVSLGSFYSSLQRCARIRLLWKIDKMESRMCVCDVCVYV